MELPPDHNLHSFPRLRKSVSATKALESERRRVESMTVLERIESALSMRKGFHPLLPKKKPASPDG